MKLLFIALVSLCVITACQNETPNTSSNIIVPPTAKIQKNPYVNLDQSPMDVSYYPANYPMQRMKQQDTFPLIARVLYSRPHKKGRVVFGNDGQSLCKYGIPWRLGANEATEVEFFRDVKLKGTAVSRGRYVMYCIPYPDKWVIKLNSNLFTWGLHIDPSTNLATIEIPVQQQNPSIEDFTMLFEEAESGVNLIMAWDDVKTVLPITF
jgi:hypothetical protein